MVWAMENEDINLVPCFNQLWFMELILAKYSWKLYLKKDYAEHISESMDMTQTLNSEI